MRPCAAQATLQAPPGGHAHCATGNHAYYVLHVGQFFSLLRLRLSHLIQIISVFPSLYARDATYVIGTLMRQAYVCSLTYRYVVGQNVEANLAVIRLTTQFQEEFAM